MNPEFKKYCWLELSIPRLIITLAIVAILFFVSITVLHTPGFATFVFYVFVFIWGVRQASQAMSDEIAQSTWDRQRMSGMSAWSLVWAKQFGSTIFSWIFGIICLIVFVWTHKGTLDNNLQYGAFLLLGGLLGQSVAFGLSLQSLQVSRSVTGVQNFGYFIIGAVIAFALNIYFENATMVVWYGDIMPGENAIIYICLFFVVWSLIGNVRLMRIELQHRNIPWVWGIFVITTAFFMTGFFPHFTSTDLEPNLNYWNNYSAHDKLIQGALGIISLSTYIIVFLESKTTMRWRILFKNLKLKNMKRALAQVPAWLVSYILCLIVGIWLICTVGNLEIALSTVVFLVFLLRDISVFVVLNLGSKNPHRTDKAALFYIVFSYVVLGGIMQGILGPYISLFFSPVQYVSKVHSIHHLNTHMLSIQIAFIAIEIAALWAWGWVKWKRQLA